MTFWVSLFFPSLTHINLECCRYPETSVACFSRLYYLNGVDGSGSALTHQQIFGSTTSSTTRVDSTEKQSKQNWILIESIKSTMNISRRPFIICFIPMSVNPVSFFTASFTGSYTLHTTNTKHRTFRIPPQRRLHHTHEHEHTTSRHVRAAPPPCSSTSKLNDTPPPQRRENKVPRVAIICLCVTVLAFVSSTWSVFVLLFQTHALRGVSSNVSAAVHNGVRVGVLSLLVGPLFQMACRMAMFTTLFSVFALFRISNVRSVGSIETDVF